MSRQRVNATPGRLGRMVAVGLVTGVVAGAIVGGIGSWLVMRILAAANYHLTGVRTESGNLAGDITVDGTMSRIIFLGIFAGVFGGLVYIIVRRWILRSGVWTGLACGVLLFMLVGYDTIEKDNIDFELFGRPLLGIALSALLFPMAERMDRYVPSLFFHRGVSAIGYLVLGGLCVMGVVRDVVNINAIL